MRVLAYVTGHGLGHAVRMAVVTEALAAAGAQVWVRGPDRPYPGATRLDGPPLDGGVVQRDSLTMDLDATLSRWQTWLGEWPAQVEAELAHVVATRPTVILSDVPALPFDVGARAGVPVIGMANFGWDWIYQPYVRRAPGFAEVIARIRASYAMSARLLRLPLHATDDFDVWPDVLDVGLIGRAARTPADETRASLGIADGPMILLSFGGHGLREIDAAALVAACPGATFVAPGIDLRAPRAIALGFDDYYHPDLVAAADVVLSKPGFGIVTECAINRTRLVYSDRGDFREYPILAAAIDAELGAIHVPRARLVAGDVGEPLARALAGPEPAPTWTAGGQHEVVRALSGW